MKLGFIGCIMGSPMAVNLARAGHHCMSRPLVRVADELLSLGAVETARQVTDFADIIFIMVPDTPQVEECFWRTGLCQTVLQGKTIVDMSSISLSKLNVLRNRLMNWADYLDAPVSGGEIGVAKVLCPLWLAVSQMYLHGSNRYLIFWVKYHAGWR